MRARRVAGLAAALALATAAAEAAPQVATLAAGGSAVEVRVRPSSGDVAAVAADPLRDAVGFLVAVPESGVAGFEVRSRTLRPLTAGEREHLIDRLRPERAAWLAERASMGEHRLQRVAVAPLVTTDEGVAALDEVVVVVRFAAAPGDATSSAGASAGRVRGRSDGDGRAPKASAWSGGPGEPAGDAAAAAVRATVVNPALVAAFAAAPPLTGVGAPGRSGFAPGACAGCLKVEVDQDGLFTVTANDLKTLPLFAGGDPREFHLYLRERELAIEVDGEDDGAFDGSDRIVFVGARNPGQHSTSTVYWLVPPDGRRGLRVARQAAVSPADQTLASAAVVDGTLRFEDQAEYNQRLPGPPGGDPWMAALIASNDQDGSEVELPLSGTGLPALDLAAPVPGRTYQLRARLVGRLTASSADEQGVSFVVNNVFAGAVTWRASQTIDPRLEVTYDPVRLRATGNRVRILQAPHPDPALWRTNYVDWVELSYPRRLIAHGGAVDFTVGGAAAAMYHVTGFAGSRIRVWAVDGGASVRLVGPRILALGPGAPTTVAFAWRAGPGGARLLAAADAGLLRPVRIEADRPSDLRRGPGSPYVVIAHPRFLAGAEALAAYRGGMAVDVTDVYDEFGGGMVDPLAIRDFLRAAAAWTVPVRLVTLVGDASMDPQDFQQLGAADYDPPSLMPTGDVVLDSVRDLRAASDTWFAQLDGDIVPDLAIGRIPVRTAGQLDDYLRKLQAYEAEPIAPWQARIQLFADDDIAQNGSECGVPGQAGDAFEAAASRYFPTADPANVVRRYAGDYRSPGAPQDLQRDVVGDLQRGIGAQFYLGHGNLLNLARHCFAGNTPILGEGQLAQVGAGSPSPLGVVMTCDAAAFDFAGPGFTGPITQGLAEQFLLAPDRGHVAWVASTAVLLYSTGAELTDATMSVLYAGDPVGPPDNRVAGTVGLGVALKVFAANGAQAGDAIDTLAILGDAGTRLQLRAP